MSVIDGNLTLSSSSPLDRFVRNLTHIDIYHPEGTGNERTDATLTKLVVALQTEKSFEAYNKLGIAYYRLFNFDAAEVCHQEHLSLSRPKKKDMLGRVREVNKKEMKVALVNLGCVFHAKRDYKLAFQAYEEAMRIAIELNDETAQARIFSNMSNVHQALYEFDPAIDCEKKRLELVKDLSDVDGQVKSACALGCLYQLKGETRNSLEYYQKAVINLKMKIVTRQLEEIRERTQGESGE